MYGHQPDLDYRDLTEAPTTVIEAIFNPFDVMQGNELLWRTCASMQMSQAFQCHYEPSKTVEGNDWAEQVTKANYLLVGRNGEIRLLFIGLMKILSTKLFYIN